MKNLNKSREKLDKIDSQIIKLLENRMKIVKDIGIYKLENNLSITDSSREDIIIENLKKQISKEFENIVEPIYDRIFHQSKEIISQIKDKNFKYGLIGESLSHSKSAEIHSMFGRYNYHLKNIERDKLEEFFTKRNFNGINVTIPYKKESIKYLDDLHPLAQKIGAVNTIVNKNGKLIGYNTDYLGFDYSLKFFDINLKDKKVLILGSGGASKMVEEYCKDNLAKNIVIISRNGENNYHNLENYKDFNVIINATPVGMYPHNLESKVDISIFDDLDFVIDLIYNPLNTKLILDAKKNNIKTMPGLLMLVAQAFYACELFVDEKLDESLISKVYKKIKRDMLNIVFIGMPASGKTTMAKLLADKLNREFWDTDVLIEEKENSSIPTIFKTKGETYFRSLETKVLEEVSKKTGVVIATGGGTILKKVNRNLILQNSFVIYLDREIENLETVNRPLSKNLDSLKEIYSNRSEIYNQLSNLKTKVIENKTKTLELILEGLKKDENFSN